MSQGPHIIVVDDEAPARELVGDYLRLHGFAVTLCDGGTSLRQAMAKLVPDLIVLDLNMAEEDGLTGDYGPNNFFLYRFANTTTFRFLPWDKSNTFWEAPSPDYFILRNILTGPENYRSLLVLRAFQEPDLLNLYFDTLLECAAFADQGHGRMKRLVPMHHKPEFAHERRAR